MRNNIKRETLIHQLFLLVIICGGVYLGFLYLLPLVFPFLLAYFLMRILWPVMTYLHKTCNWPFYLANYSVLFAFLSLVLLTIIYLFGKIMSQLRLFFTNFPVYQQLFTNTLCRQTNYLCNCIDYYLHLDNGTSQHFFDQQIQTLEQRGMDFISNRAGETIIQGLISSFHIFSTILIVIISMIILAKEMLPLNEAYRQSRYYSSIHSILVCLKTSGMTYLRTESLILVINAVLCSLGLFLIRNPYFFILGIAISVFDAFPILGSGFIFLPWCVFEFINGNYYYAAILITTYLATLFIREYLEAKMLGNGMGMNPFFTIASIFIGIDLFGIAGIFLGPFAIVLIRTLLAECQKV